MCRLLKCILKFEICTSIFFLLTWNSFLKEFAIKILITSVPCSKILWTISPLLSVKAYQSKGVLYLYGTKLITKLPLWKYDIYNIVTRFCAGFDGHWNFCTYNFGPVTYDSSLPYWSLTIITTFNARKSKTVEIF